MGQGLFTDNKALSYIRFGVEDIEGMDYTSTLDIVIELEVTEFDNFGIPQGTSVVELEIEYRTDDGIKNIIKII